MKTLRRLFVTAILIWASLAPALGIVSSVQIAHPALWTVHTKAATAYLFGSIHLLPADVDWRSDAIETAISRSDTFVFEIPMDDTAQASIAAFVSAHGQLPAGQSLRQMLPAAMDAKFDQVVTSSGLKPEAVDRMQPWLASLVLAIAAVRNQHLDANFGPDVILHNEATRDQKNVLSFETVQQQLALVAPSDRNIGIESLATTLDDIVDQPTLTGDLLDAWEKGDTQKMESLLNGNLSMYPGARKIFLDDRNKAWVKKLTLMLKHKHTYFVTVGAGHLVGRTGVPALLRRAGFQVDGP